jgi:hypothetical protein
VCWAWSACDKLVLLLPVPAGIGFNRKAQAEMSDQAKSMTVRKKVASLRKRAQDDALAA